jgi:predicted dehydrogenase
MPSRRVTRREFVRRSSSIGTLTAVGGYFAATTTRKTHAARSPNQRLLVAQVGCGGMGSGDAGAHAVGGDVVALCDVDLQHAERLNAKNRRINRHNPMICRDYRRVLDRKDIDVVSIGTPDHWHVKIAIEALMAGKHVFCQKPLTLTLEENQLCRAAAKKYSKQVFFVGTQQRSDRSRFLRAVNLVQKGLLGDIERITVGINGGQRGGPFEKTTPPPELDWNMWLGQAPKVPYIKERCHGSFRWWYEYAGGKFTDWGAHHVDIASWATGQDQAGMGPIEIDGTDAQHPVPLKDGYPTVDDCYNTSYDFAVKCKFKGGMEMIIDSRSPNGILFEGTEGRLFVNRGKITGKPIEEHWDEGKFTDDDLVRLFKGKPPQNHKQNFYRCIREGGLPVSDVFSHVQILNTCHLAAIAARLGRVIKWDPKAEKILNDDLAASFFARTPRNGFEIPS